MCFKFLSDSFFNWYSRAHSCFFSFKCRDFNIFFSLGRVFFILRSVSSIFNVFASIFLSLSTYSFNFPSILISKLRIFSLGTECSLVLDGGVERVSIFGVDSVPLRSLIPSLPASLYPIFVCFQEKCHDLYSWSNQLGT